jgi:hypothetical protein
MVFRSLQYLYFRLEGERLKGKEEDMDEEMDEGEDHMKGMLYTIYSFILHQQRLRAQEQLQAGASSLPACRLASSPPPPALCSPTSPVDWDRLRQPVGLHLQYNATLQRHISEIRNKYIPRKENARPQSQFPHSCACERLIYVFPRSV